MSISPVVSLPSFLPSTLPQVSAKQTISDSKFISSSSFSSLLRQELHNRLPIAPSFQPTEDPSPYLTFPLFPPPSSPFSSRTRNPRLTYSIYSRPPLFSSRLTYLYRSPIPNPIHLEYPIYPPPLPKEIYSSPPPTPSLRDMWFEMCAFYCWV